MKKLLLFYLFTFGLNLSAQQVYWDEYAIGFPYSSASVGQISYADANTVWTYATNQDGTGGYHQRFARSLDSGHSWTQGPINIGSIDLAIASIHAMSPTTAYCTVFPLSLSVQGGIFRTIDSGVSWQKQTSALFSTGNESFTNFVHFFDNDNGVAQGDPASGYFEIYTTTDGGTNWVRVPQGNIPPPLPSEYGFIHNYEVVGNKIWFGTNMGRIFISSDMGYTWTVAQGPIIDFDDFPFTPRFAMKDQFNGIMTGSDYQFYRTTDGAITWVAEVTTGEIRNYDVAYVPGTSNMYLCTGEDIYFALRGSSYSVDGGSTWIDINAFDVLPVDWGESLACYDIDHALASGFTVSPTEGGIWELIGGSLSNVDFKSAANFTASPNPTSGILDIAGQNISQVVVYEILGKQISNTNYSSLNNVSLNLSALNNGVYMVKVTNNAGASSTIKVVKQ